MTKPTEAEFREHVQREFSYLTTKFGLELVDDDPGLESFHVLYQSSSVFVAVRGTDFGADINVQIGPPPFRDRRSGWPLWLIILTRDPDLNPESIRELGQLARASRAARNLELVCRDFLAGDFSRSPELAEALEKLWEADPPNKADVLVEESRVLWLLGPSAGRTIEQAYRLVENLDYPEGLKRKFAPGRALLQIDRRGRVLEVQRFKDTPTEQQRRALSKKYPGTVQISGQPGSDASADRLEERVREAASTLRKLKA